MSLTNCKINPLLTWFAYCAISCATGETKFSKTDFILLRRLYVPAVTLSTQNSAKPLQELKSGLKEQLTGTKVVIKTKEPYLDCEFDPIFME